jgi:hypothetical protein
MEEAIGWDSTAQVAEPGTLLLFGTSLLSLAAFRRWRKQPSLAFRR